MRRQGGRMKSGLSQEEERVPDAATNQVDSQPNHSGRLGTVTIRRPLSEVLRGEEPAPGTIPAGVAWIQVREARKALAITAANFFGHPAKALELVAVTGTNGKTTTTSLVDTIVKASGGKTGLFGTIAYHTPLGDYPAPNTTPESVDLQGFFAEVRDAGGKYAVLEASSHSLAMDRLWGCHFQAAVFTNLTREHMDFHKTFEDYFARSEERRVGKEGRSQ